MTAKRELILDYFAGGGGASCGIEMALGRSPDFAVNHDATAVAMHRANHPETEHLKKDVWQVNPLDLVHNEPVGLFWASPDCKHFSKAKGGKPVKKNIRDLAWVVVLVAKRARPRVIILENVEEFRTWGPLTAENMPDPARKGQEFERWSGELRRLGYKMEWRELRACDYGAPTIRKRFFMIARRDGRPIVWPEPTHGYPKSDAVTSGRLLPWRTAAEIIDWSLPCHSIFLTREEGRALGVKRPLADATMARIAKGVKRYVIDAAEPFIVSLTHHGGDRNEPIGEPMRTVTGAHRGEKAVVSPVVVRTAHGEQDKKGKKRGQGAHDAEAPLHTVTASPDFAIAGATLIQTGYGERPGQSPRVPGLEKPLGTAVGGAVKHALVAPVITKFHPGNPGQSVEEPLATITANSFIKRSGGAPTMGVVAPVIVGCGGRAAQSPPRPVDQPNATTTAKADQVLVAPHLMTMRNAEKPHNEADRPAHTITAQGAHLNLVGAFMAKHFGGPNGKQTPGADLREPASTITGQDHQAVVSAGVVNMKGSERRGGAIETPSPAQTAQGWHIAEVRAFCIKYYGQGIGQQVTEPAHTLTTKERLGLVTVHGEEYQIVDIGMRMLSPPELFAAQGFPPDYIIDRRANGEKITKTDQIRMVGNSVSPPVAAALVAANCADLAVRRASRGSGVTGMATATECIKGKCGCPKAENCSFVRCKNCDWPVDSNGKTLVDHSCSEEETCPDCGGPATENLRRVYGALSS